MPRGISSSCSGLSAPLPPFPVQVAMALRPRRCTSLCSNTTATTATASPWRLQSGQIMTNLVRDDRTTSYFFLFLYTPTRASDSHLATLLNHAAWQNEACRVHYCLRVSVSWLNELAMTPDINTHTHTHSLSAGLFTLPDPETTNQVQLNLLILIEET